MTLQDLFNLVAENPAWIIFYFSIIPVTALIAGFTGKGEGHLTPWKYLYSTLIYLVCVPGILSAALSVSQFLFNRSRDMLQLDIFFQILPVLSMIITLMIIRRNVSFEYIPGFDKLSGLITMIVAAMGVMWLLDRVHFIVFATTRFEMVILIFVVLLIILRFGWRRMFRGSPSAEQ